MTRAVLSDRKPTFYYGWTIVGACVLAQLSTLGVMVNCFSIFLPGWSHEFHTPASALTTALFLFAVGAAVFSAPAGLAADKLPIRVVMGLGLTSVALVHILMGFATAGWQIIAVYALLLSMVATFSTGIPSQTVVSRWFVRRRGMAMGLTAFGLAMAGVVFPPAITYLLPAIGWRATFWLFGAVIGLVVMPIVVLLLRDRPTAQEGAEYLTAEPAAETAADITIKEILSRRNFWVIAGAFVMVMFASGGAVINLIPLALSRGQTLQTGGLLLSVFGLAALIGKLSSGLLADRLGNRIPFAMLAAATAGGLALLAVAHSLPLFLPALAMVGLSQGIWTLLPSSVAAEFGSRAFGRAIGVISVFLPLGSLSPALVALAFERTHDYTPSLFGLAALALGACALVLAGLRERR